MRGMFPASPTRSPRGQAGVPLQFLTPHLSLKVQGTWHTAVLGPSELGRKHAGPLTRVTFLVVLLGCPTCQAAQEHLPLGKFLLAQVPFQNWPGARV
jgi:hypothetical protein